MGQVHLGTPELGQAVQTGLDHGVQGRADGQGYQGFVSFPPNSRYKRPSKRCIRSRMQEACSSRYFALSKALIIPYTPSLS